MKLADRRGNIEECSSGQDRLLEWIYTHETGRFLMKGLINPHISEIGAAFFGFSGLQSADCVVYPEEQDSDVSV